MIFCGIRRKIYKFHGKQQNAMANLETGKFSSGLSLFAIKLYPFRGSSIQMVTNDLFNTDIIYSLHAG